MFREQRGKLHIKLQKKEVKKLEPSHIAGGECENGTATLGSILAVPQNVKHRVAV